MRETYFGPLLQEVETKIRDQVGDAWDRELFEHALMGYGMRTDRYRLVAWIDTRHPERDPVCVELFDHANDPSETTNVAADHPDLITWLIEQLRASPAFRPTPPVRHDAG